MYTGPALDFRSSNQMEESAVFPQELLDLKVPQGWGTGDTSPSGSQFNFPLTAGGEEVLPLLDLSGRNSAMSGGKVAVGGWGVELQDLVNGDDPFFATESIYSGQVLEKPAADELGRPLVAGKLGQWL